MKSLATAKRAAILQALCEGMSVRATSRITGAATNTILDLIAKAGEACAAYQDENLRNLPCDNVQMDELFAFIGCREKNKREGSQHYGDIWTWIAIDSTTKLRITWHTGDRSHRSAFAICQDLSKRIPANAQITSDGLASYKFAIGSTMPEAQFAQLVKVYDKDSQGREIVTRADKMPVFGDPDPSRISTSHVEASNLHMRMQNRRYARLTNAHSKKVRNHNLMLAIGFMAYNFCRKHMTLKKTPAMAAGVADRQWSMEDVVAMCDRYHETKVATEFEEAFEARFTPKRTTPKTYAPTPKSKLALPWYLRPDGEPPSSELP